MKRLDQLLLTICFVPTYVWYVRRMGEGGEDLLSALLLPVCVGIAYYQQKGKAWNIGLLTVSGTVLYVLLWSLGVPAMIKATLAITVLLHASGLLRNFGFSALAYLSLPWLSSFQFFFGYPLRRVVAEGAAFLLKFTGLAVEAEGTGLSFQGASVFVDPPCSGVRMLWAILVLVGLVSVITSRGWRSGMLLCLSAIIMAVFNPCSKNSHSLCYLSLVSSLGNS